MAKSEGRVLGTGFSSSPSLSEAYLRQKLAESGVPEQFHGGLIRWVVSGIQPGHFLTAILANDLAEACTRADQRARLVLYEIVFFLYNYAPAPCWHSPANVKAWREQWARAREESQDLLTHEDPAPDRQ